MQKYIAFFLIIFLIMPMAHLPAQANITTTTTTTENDAKNIPQWAKDLRRWEIVTFGSIPFSMFTVTFAMDMVRWSKANGLNFNDRRYAPWPLKSAGAIAMEDKEQELTIIIAAGVSVAIGIIDLIIVQAKRYKARKRAEAIPVGTVDITTKPWPSDSPDDENQAPESE